MHTEAPEISATDSESTGVSRVNNEIEVGYDASFENKWWKFEVSCWVAVTIVLIAALAGVFGRGPLSKSRIQSADGSLTVESERVVHFRTPAEVKLEVPPESVPNNNVAQVWINSAFYQRLQLQRVVPQPMHSISADGGTVFTFPVAPGAPARISLRLEPSSVGPFQGEVRVPGHALVHVRSLVLP